MPNLHTEMKMILYSSGLHLAKAVHPGLVPLLMSSASQLSVLPLSHSVLDNGPASGCAPSSSSSHGRHATGSLLSKRHFAVSVNVTNGDVEDAWKQLRRKCADADLPKELRKREHYENPSERKFLKQKVAYNRAMGRIIHVRTQWLAKRSR